MSRAQHGQSRPPAPPVSQSPPLPILKRYEGELPDPSSGPPILLPLLQTHSNVKNSNAPPTHWSSLDISPRPFPYADWQCTTHTLPAAYPRSHPASTAPYSQTYPARQDHEPKVMTSPEEEKKQKKTHLALYHDYIQRNSPMTYHPPPTHKEADVKAQAFVDDCQPRLWNVINRYAPQKSTDGVTLIFGHGTGLHKETWEPAMQAILEHTRIPIRECWSIDMVMCGQSSLLNRDDLGEVVHMHDHARDLLNFVLHYLPEESGSVPPSVLPRRTSEPRRKVILVAHSVSASMWAIASHLRPDLFSDVALIDATSLKYTPQIALERSGMLNGGGSQIVAITRRDAWQSRQAAIDAIRSNRVYAQWDKRCLDSFLRYGIRDGAHGASLACPKQLEAAGYRSIWLASYTWPCFRERARDPKRYPRTLSLRIANTFLLDEEQGAEYQGLIAQCGGTVETWGQGAQHLIVETEPARLGAFVAQWLNGGGRQEARL